MAQRLGKHTLFLPSLPAIIGYAAVAGKKEGEGPLGEWFDHVSQDEMCGQESFELAEKTMYLPKFVNIFTEILASKIFIFSNFLLRKAEI